MREQIQNEIKAFTFDNIDVAADHVVTEPLAIAESLWLHAKVYPSGGENSLHTHPLEDHAFIVLRSEAVFYDGHDVAFRVGPHSGVLLPKGTSYRFHSVGEEPLVAIRVGGAPRDAADDDPDPRFPRPMSIRQRPDGTPFPGDDPDNVRLPAPRRDRDQAGSGGGR